MQHFKSDSRFEIFTMTNLRGTKVNTDIAMASLRYASLKFAHASG